MTGESREAVTCSSCGRQVSPYASRCIYCGRSRGVQCPNCKRYSGEDAVRCSYCGARLDAVDKGEQKGGMKPTVMPMAGREFAPVRGRGEAPSGVAIAVIALIIAGGGLFYAWRDTRWKREKALQYEQMLLTWGEADAELEAGNASRAVVLYRKALDMIKTAQLDAPDVERAIAESLEGVEPQPAPVASAKKPRKSLHASSVAEPRRYEAIRIRVGSVSTGFFAGKACVDLWLNVKNTGTKPYQFDVRKIQVLLKDGTTYPVADPTEQYHLRSTILAPNQSTSGVVVLQFEDGRRVSPDQISGVVYAGKIAVPVREE